MRNPDKIGKVGKAWRSTARDHEMIDMWFINLPDFHPMLQWFTVCEWIEYADGQTTTVFAYALDPESYLWQDVDPDKFKEQKITFLPTEILKHSLSKKSVVTHPVLLAAFVQALTEGQLQPDEDNKQELANFLTNTERWLSK